MIKKSFLIIEKINVSRDISGFRFGSGKYKTQYTIEQDPFGYCLVHEFDSDSLLSNWSVWITFSFSLCILLIEIFI